MEHFRGLSGVPKEVHERREAYAFWIPEVVRSECMHHEVEPACVIVTGAGFRVWAHTWFRLGCSGVLEPVTPVGDLVGAVVFLERATSG